MGRDGRFAEFMVAPENCLIPHRAPLPASAEDSRWHMGIPRTTTKQGGLK